MEQGLLFDRVYVPGARFPVHERIEDAAPVLANRADTPFPVADDAVVPAKVAMYLAVLTFLVERGFFHDGLSFWGSFVFSVVLR